MKQILFNTEMVRAILDGRKTVTRRAIKPKYRDDEYGFQIVTTMSGEFIRVEKLSESGSSIFPDGTERHLAPPYCSGDILYVRETWGRTADLPGISEEATVYAADFSDQELANLKDRHFRWRPSIHMPKDKARLFLRVIKVRAERLQSISPDGCAMEGIWPLYSGSVGGRSEYYYDKFSHLWDSTIPRAELHTYGWGANPWVWRIEFEVCEKPEV